MGAWMDGCAGCSVLGLPCNCASCCRSCLLYQQLPLARFPCALACEATHFLLDGQPRPVALRQPSPAHPIMADLGGREVGSLWFAVKAITTHPPPPLPPPPPRVC